MEDLEAALTIGRSCRRGLVLPERGINSGHRNLVQRLATKLLEACLVTSVAYVPLIFNDDATMTYEMQSWPIASLANLVHQ